jgi:hypothetical protein
VGRICGGLWFGRSVLNRHTRVAVPLGAVARMSGVLVPASLFSRTLVFGYGLLHFSFLVAGVANGFVERSMDR